MRLALAFTLVLFHAGSARAAPPMQWPVPLDRGVSSNFCEYRDGRFHAGIDVRTYGREGVPCLAVADGWISRVRAGSRGYGKALHLALDDGTQLVYAHLSEYAPALEDTLLAVQMSDTTYNVDFRPPPGRFRVQAGDTIAYSGATGASAPHLHLETRDARDRPFNPFNTDLSVPDSRSPQILRVVFVPLTAESRLGGRCLPFGVTPHRVAQGRYVIDDTLRVSGRVGIAISALDRANSRSGRLAPKSFEVYADDSLRSRIVLDEFPFESSAEVDHLYNAGALRARGTSFFQLWDTGNMPFSVQWTDGGTLPTDTTRAHRGWIGVRDGAGNVSSVEFVFVCGTFASDPHENSRTRRDLTAELNDAFFQDGFAAIPLSPDDGGEPMIITARNLGNGIRPLAAFADDDTASLWPVGLTSQEARQLRFPHHGMTIELAADVARTDQVVYVRGAPDAGEALSGLERLSKPVRVGPVGWVLHASMTIHLDFEHPGANEAIYRYDDYRKSWSYLVSRTDSTGLNAKTDRPGVFAVFRDVEPPRVGKPAFARVPSWGTDGVRREIHIPAADAGSGFDETRTIIRVGGVKQIFRWDFAKKRLVVPLADDSIIGNQSVHVVAYDRSGHRTTRAATINTGKP